MSRSTSRRGSPVLVPKPQPRASYPRVREVGAQGRPRDLRGLPAGDVHDGVAVAAGCAEEAGQGSGKPGSGQTGPRARRTQRDRSVALRSGWPDRRQDGAARASEGPPLARRIAARAREHSRHGSTVSPGSGVGAGAGPLCSGNGAFAQADGRRACPGGRRGGLPGRGGRGRRARARPGLRRGGRLVPHHGPVRAGPGAAGARAAGRRATRQRRPQLAGAGRASRGRGVRDGPAVRRRAGGAGRPHADGAGGAATTSRTRRPASSACGACSPR